MAGLGLKPGVQVSVSEAGKGWLMTAKSAQEGLLLDERYGQHLFISPLATK
jgi:hypothetical protein